MLERLTASRKKPYIPGIKSPERVQFDLSGSSFSIAIPPHSATDPLMKPETMPGKINIFDQSQYVRSNDPSDPFSLLTLLRRRWSIFGGILDSGYIGSIDFSVSVEHVDLPEGMSCLNPGHFEQVIIKKAYLNEQLNNPYAGHYIAPLNWVASNDWVLYERHRDLSRFKEPEDFLEAQYFSYIQAALDDRHFLKMVFSNLGYAPANHAITNMNSIRDSVLKSINFDLSANSCKMREVAISQAKQKQLSKTRKPESWKYADDNNPGSPLPEFII